MPKGEKDQKDPGS